MMAIIPPAAGAAATGVNSGSSNDKGKAKDNGSNSKEAGASEGSKSNEKKSTKSSRAASGSHAPSTRTSPARGASTNPPNTTSIPSRTRMGQSTSNTASSTHNGPPAPLSSMTSPPLDLNSVERRGQPTASRESGKRKNRPHGIEEAPTYTPTDDEWKDPMEYMRKIAPEASKFGICKIIPPDSWNPPFSIDTTKFHFQTRKQELNSVEGGSRVNISYLDGLFKYHKNLGNTLTRLPYVDKKPLDLYQLKRAVDSRGGFDNVCKFKKWAEIGRDLGYSGKIMSSLSTSLKNSYQKWLCPYEDYLRVAKPGVHQQLEIENGGPFTTPDTGNSPMKRSSANTPSSIRGDSPARQASDALQAATGSQRATPTTTRSTPPRPGSSGGFTAINSRNGSPFTAGKSSDKGLAPAHPLKRQLGEDSSEVSLKEELADGDEDEDGSARRSKRLKKEAVPRVAGSNMSQLRPQQARIPREDAGETWEVCEQCGKGESAGFLCVCESCDYAYHGKCLDPPISSKPTTEWNCPRCLVGDGQYGFEDGGLYSLKQFQEKAAEFKQNYFETKMPVDSANNCHRPVTEDDVEQEFWRLVSSIDDNVEVEYGADIHCTTHGSGFPTIEKNPNDPYSTDPWNLNILPLHPESIFRYIKSDISGMTVPWVYVGMIFSTFCWHNEDHYAYSANYQHFGATKTWYGIPGEDAEKFENAMREAVPDLFETQPDLLFQLVTLLPPEKLKEAGVRVYAVDQRAGQLVITFPQAYHAGFNHGFNFNEAVNFAPSDWEPFGLAGVDRLQQFRRQPCFSHEELLWSGADDVTSTATGPLTIRTAKWLAPALERIRDREASYRAIFLTRHSDVPHKCQFAENDNDGNAGRRGASDSSTHNCPLTLTYDNSVVPEDEYQCSYCKAFTYLSRFKCNKTGKIMCLQHAGTHTCCQARDTSRLLGEHHTLIYRHSEEEIDAMYKKVADKAALPQVWEEKYDRLLEEDATPSLRSLRAILNEGERIPYDLPSLPVLREFVDRCNHWVEEATNYIVRKQQNRRKNDKTSQASGRKSISAGSGENDEKERETRNISNIYRLLDEAVRIGFECPEIMLLQQRADAIKVFQENARRALEHVSTQTAETIETLLEDGQAFNVDVPEVEKLVNFLEQLKWTQRAEASRSEHMTLEDVNDLLDTSARLGISPYGNDHIRYFQELAANGKQWEKKAAELLQAETVHYPQLEALSHQAAAGNIPVTAKTLERIDQMLEKHRDAHRRVLDLNNRCHEPDYRSRPTYNEVIALMNDIYLLQSKPPGTHDLEKEQRKNEDWMRQGKRIFGKTNAPLYILKSHMEHVLARNKDCFDTQDDKPRSPVEPASREPSPEAGAQSWQTSKREVFCICRRTEAGMMIECEVCHEWYHGKCLKIARGKVKEDEKYTCPICDWRVKIPRDAARPDLESLVALFNDIPNLPFQTDEEQLLSDIINNAIEFQDKIKPYIDPDLTSKADAIKQRFYLRKIEGAEILLTRETNFLRQVLHKRFPVAPDPPPLIEESKSTRKPRPTKLQKLMAQHQVDDFEDLPDVVKHDVVKMRTNSARRRGLAAGVAGDNGHSNFRSGTMVPLAPAVGGPHEESMSPGSGGGGDFGTSPSMRMDSAFGDFRRSSGMGSSSAAKQPRQPLDRHSTVIFFDIKKKKSSSDSNWTPMRGGSGSPIASDFGDNAATSLRPSAGDSAATSLRPSAGDSGGWPNRSILSTVNDTDPKVRPARGLFDAPSPKDQFSSADPGRGPVSGAGPGPALGPDGMDIDHGEGHSSLPPGPGPAR